MPDQETTNAEIKFMSPCQHACPIHQDVPKYIACIAQRKYDQAAAVIRESNPMPYICATICAHHCETECRRTDVDKPLSIRGLKRFAIENTASTRPSNITVKRKTTRVAVIGSGPAGLTAAHDLVLCGYGVTVFEKETVIGGAPRLVLPGYRLPDNLIERDINAIKELGVEIRTKTELGINFTINTLKNDGFAAIILALGLPVSRGLAIPGAEHQQVLLALPFLRDVKAGKVEFKNKSEVIVVGGGNVAIDVARSALRIGAGKVRLACLEGRDEMPAWPWEIEEALEEGVEIDYCGLGPKQVVVGKDKIAGLECKKCLSVFDSQGRFNPAFLEEEISMVKGNVVIVAIGQAANLPPLVEMGVALNERGQIIFNRDSMATTRPDVFCAGEVISGPGSAVQAMASGRKAAVSVMRYLEGKGAHSEISIPVLGKLKTQVQKEVIHQDRVSLPVIGTKERITNFRQVELGYGEELALKEARRCLSCGNGAVWLKDKCAFCLTCVRVCPYEVPVVTPGQGIDIRIDQCQACGICYNECPARAIDFEMANVSLLGNEIKKLVQQKKQKQSQSYLVLYCSFFQPGLKEIDDIVSKHPDLIILSVPCLVKLSVSDLLDAITAGAKGIVAARCPESDCIYRATLPWIERRIQAARNTLAELQISDRYIDLIDAKSAKDLELALVSLKGKG